MFSLSRLSLSLNVSPVLSVVDSCSFCRLRLKCLDGIDVYSVSFDTDSKSGAS